jgi:uncharacterized damage-inducible protein DinB
LLGRHEPWFAPHARIPHIRGSSQTDRAGSLDAGAVTMSIRQNLSNQLLTVWNGDPWYGSSSSKILAGVTAAEALAHPLPGAQSIWETVLHMTAWTEEVTSRLSGGEAKAPARGDWPAAKGSSQDEWMAVQGDLLAARKALLHSIENSHEESLLLQVPKPGEAHASGVTRASTLSGLADHDVYHLGQIALLKKSLKHGSIDLA